MTRYGLSAEKENELIIRMHRLKVFEKDIKESFIHSSGPGGQNVNKVATCVTLVHEPTRIRVKCQSERTQGLNRYKARCLLLDKIEKKERDRRLVKQQAAAKKKRQNRRRSKASKEKMLEAKRKRAEKKQRRRKVSAGKFDF